MILIKFNTAFLFNFLHDVHLFVFLLQELSRVISFKAIFFLRITAKIYVSMF